MSPMSKKKGKHNSQLNPLASQAKHKRDYLSRLKIVCDNLNYILGLVKSPYHQWRVEINEMFFPHDSFAQLQPTDLCPCNSGEKYLDCCLSEPGVRGFDYQFKVKDNALARAAKKK